MEARAQPASSAARGARLAAFGASVKGPAHAAAGAPNQDAWASGHAGNWRVVAVADGLGSRPLADVGAKAACAAVVEAVRRWRRNPAAPTEVLLALVHVLWRARVAPRPPEDCASTCLFAALGADGAGVAGQLGDGMLLVRDGAGLRPLHQRPPGDFANETAALGVTKHMSAWQTATFSPGARAVVLCTDGIADDLLPDKLDEFATWALNHRDLAPRARGAALRAALRSWPTPAHTDDKTLAVLEAHGVTS